MSGCLTPRAAMVGPAALGASCYTLPRENRDMPLAMHTNPPGQAIPGISAAVIAPASKLVFLTGYTPLDNTGRVVKGGFAAQVRQVFESLRSTLEAAGSDFDQVLRLTIYVTDLGPDELAVVRETRDRFINPSKAPASALIGVAALFHEDVRIEVDAVAQTRMQK